LLSIKNQLTGKLNLFKRKSKTKSATLPSAASKGGQVASSSSSPTKAERLGIRIIDEYRDGSGSKVIDIIFVHGLGGSARETWTHSSSKAFWPSLLLEDNTFADARISTFGYDANFKNVFGANNVLDISDFAKQLLDRLDLHYERFGEVS
jgi:hypothetical protein